MSDIRSRIKALLQQLQQGIYEKNTETSLALLAALSGESILLLGPPGVAKSMIARRLKHAFYRARSFEYLMSRFSTPDEIFGPVSIAKLKESDCYERSVDGFLPTADVVFLDEIWKAGPAIQNTLLTVLNEKLFRNGDKELKLPLKLLVAASNELPAKGEGLEALWDRFSIRIICRSIQSEDLFRKMLCGNLSNAESSRSNAESSQSNAESSRSAPQSSSFQAEDASCSKDLNASAQPIRAKEYALWRTESEQVELTISLLDAITYIRKQILRVEVSDSELPRRIYVSDRRWKHIAALLRTSAYVQGRKQATPADLIPMYHCIWNEPAEIDPVREITIQAIFDPLRQQLQRLSDGVKADLRAYRAEAALAKAARDNDHRDDDLLIVDRFFYQVENHGTGHTYVFITDFKRLPSISKQNAAVQGIMFRDKSSKGRCIIRMFSPDIVESSSHVQKERVMLCRDNDHIYINGVAFGMRHKGSAVLNPQGGKIGSLFDAVVQPISDETQIDTADIEAGISANYKHYETDIEYLCEETDSLKRTIDDNLFASAEDKAQAAQHVQDLYKKVALCRVDIRKLLYNEE